MGYRRARFCCFAYPTAFVAALVGLVGLPPSASASELRLTPAVQAVAAAQPAVVNIHGQKTMQREAVDHSSAEQGRRVNGMGTGVVLDERGYILTNFHVVDGVREIHVTLADRSTVLGRLIAYDRQDDLAIVKVDAEGPLDTIPIGTSSDLMPAETVIAIGNAYGYEHTVTQGIISALHRDVQVSETQYYEDLIQTSAPINPGNSGGPLLNIDGEMIGINVAVRAGAQNIAFAIPVDRAIETAAKLLSVERRDENWHGMIVVQRHTGQEQEVVVKDIEPGSPAETTGLEPGDKIRQIDDMPVERGLDIERALLGRRDGEKATVEVVRDGRSQKLELTLASRTKASSQKSYTTLQQRTWDVFGLLLEEVPRNEFQRRQTPYSGGLKVVDVRRGGPAERQGIQTGDVLVGMHGWETASEQDIRYIVSLPRLSELGAIKFFILRGPETLYGHLRVARRVSKVMAANR